MYIPVGGYLEVECVTAGTWEIRGSSFYSRGKASAGYIDVYADSDVDTDAYTRYSTVVIELTNAQIKLLATTPVELVAAPGAGALIEFVSAVLVLDYGSNVLTEPSAPDDLAIEYNNGTGTQIATWDSTALITAAADTIEQVNGASIAARASATDANRNVVLLNTGTDYTGNAGNDTTMRVIVTYRVHADLGL